MSGIKYSKKEGNIIKSANKVDTRWIIAVFPALLPGTSQSVLLTLELQDYSVNWMLESLGV